MLEPSIKNWEKEDKTHKIERERRKSRGREENKRKGQKRRRVLKIL